MECTHAIATGARILLVETPVAETSNGTGFRQYMAAENFVVSRHLGAVISQSFSLPEQNFRSASFVRSLRYAYRNAYRDQVTVLAASNDVGVSGPTTTKANPAYDHRVVYWPASDPLVTGVGGTRLRLDAAGREVSPATAWNDTFDPSAVALFGATAPFPVASSGGGSRIFGRPACQNNTVVFNLGTGPQRVVGYRAKRGYDLVTGVGTIDAARFVPELADLDASGRHRRS